MKVIATNRKAKYNYQIIKKFEAGIVLKGMEVKSLRQKGCSLEESFARVEKGEVFLYNMHIPEFDKASFFKTDPKRPRKLLLHKREIEYLLGATTQKKMTIIPVKIYFNQRGIVKVELALARGQKLYDKRRKIKEEIAEKEALRSIKNFRQKAKY